MKVYVDKDDKDFLDACLSECRVYEYVADELHYSDRLKLVNLADRDKQVRKEVVQEVRSLIDKYIVSMNSFIDDYGLNELIEDINQLQGE